jgi:hypothetical protein
MVNAFARTALSSCLRQAPAANRDVDLKGIIGYIASIIIFVQRGERKI